MLVSLNWLKQYVDLQGLSAEALAEKITRSGIEVDGIHYVAEKSENIVVGHIQSCEQHPNADQLKVCQVDVGEEVLQIVCGASNVQKDQKVAVAKIGATLPGNFEIKEVDLRGVQSKGMICSLEEIGIDTNYIAKEDEEGIFVFPADVVVGESIEKYLNLDDAILEFDLTPNRADALSMLGVAYEVAAILDESIQLPTVSEHDFIEEKSDFISISLKNKEINPYYAAFLIEDVEIKESPLWMKNYLIASGIRPINNVVDITNYVLLEYGQPLHAFDYDLLPNKEIVTRLAKNGEKITTLDGQTRTLKEDHLLITDGKNPLALAGVMGGQSTEVRESTKNILLEAAYFSGVFVRKTVKDTGLRSDASNRFEKGVNPCKVYEAGLRAVDLLVKYANGKFTKTPVVADYLKKETVEIEVPLEQVNHRLGTNITHSEIKKILRKLRFNYEEKGNVFYVSIPSRRQDVQIFEDMLEEIARIYGYDRLPSTLPKSNTIGRLTKKQALKREVKKYLEGVGLREVITYSLTDKNKVNELISPDIEKKNPKAIRLALPMTEEHEFLRLSILPELVKIQVHNEARYEKDVHIYDIGSVFISNDPKKQPDELDRLSCLVSGKWLNHPWQQDIKEVDFFLIKGIVEGLFHHLQIECSFVKGRVKEMHPGQTALIEVNGEIIGFLGQIHPKYAADCNIEKSFVFDLDFDYLVKEFEQKLTYQPIPRYPSISRDIALLVDQTIEANTIQEAIKEVAGDLLIDISVFDLYEGKNIEKNKKSIAFHLIYQHAEKTLQDEDVQSSYEKIVSMLENQFDAEIRL